MRIPLEPESAYRLEPVSYDSLPGFREEGLLQIWPVFISSAEAMIAKRKILRPAAPPPRSLWNLWRAAPRSFRSDRDVLQFLVSQSRPYRISVSGGAHFTAYYEPECLGSLEPDERFPAPIFGLPANGSSAGLTRKAIDEGALSDRPLLWLRDAIEVYKVHVQGSAKVRLPDGKLIRIAYAGRNSYPYSSLAQALIAKGLVAKEDATADVVYSCVRKAGLSKGQAGLGLLHLNESYIFFSLVTSLADGDGPLGGAGLPLAPQASIAIDRKVWPYGQFFWISCPWPEPPRVLSRLTVSQDTGAAIVGAARADIFLGSGEQAGRLAGKVNERGEMFAILPRVPEGAGE